MPPLLISTNFRKIRRATRADKKPLRRDNTIDAGVGDFGCNNLVRVAKIRKQIGQRSAIYVLMHADTNELAKFENEVARYVSRSRIFGIHINMMHGNGNGKDPEECINNFHIWSKLIDDMIGRIVAKKTARGAWYAVYHVGTGGSAPALIYMMEKLSQYFYKKFVIVGEPRDEASSTNEAELLTRLTWLDDNYRTLYAYNSQDGAQGESVDWSNASVETAITSGCYRFDASDFASKKHGLGKFTALNCGVGSIPYYRKWIFWVEQNYERTLESCTRLVKSMNLKAGERVVLVGDCREEIANLAIKQAYPLGTPIQYRKIIGVAIDEWNVVAGRLRNFVPVVAPTPNYDKLAKLMGEKDKVEVESRL